MSTPAATALPVSVEVKDIPTNVVVIASETMERIAALKSEAATIVITDAATAESAAGTQRDAKTLFKEIDNLRLTLKRPFMDAEAKIDTAAKGPLAILKKITEDIGPRLARWQEHCEELARQAEAKRQADIRAAEEARVKAEQQAAQAEKERLAALAVQAAPVADDVVEFAEYDVVIAESNVEAAQATAAEIARKSAALQQTRAVIVAPAKPTGISFRKVLNFVVDDVQKLPTHLVTVIPNDAAIRAQFVTGWKNTDPVPTHPGLRFIVDTQTVTQTARR